MHRLPISLALVFAATLAGQPATPPKCLGGTLVSIQQDSITVRLNERTSVIHVTPETEIWRRGVDLDSTAKLILGEQVFPVCEQMAADGLPTATLVAEVEGEDAVYLVPHHVQEIRPCGGGMITAAKDTVTARSDDGKIWTIHVTPETVVWRGEIYHDTGALHRGDAISARCIVHFPDEVLIADEIWANLTEAEGVIVKILPDTIIVDQGKGDRHSAYPRGHATVVIDDRTHFEEGSTRADLQPGRHIRAEGLELGRSRFRASVIHIYER